MFLMQQPLKSTPTVEQSFGAQVHYFRTLQNISQREFAQRLTERGMAVDASAVSRIESGARAIRLSEALTIAEVLDVDLDMLVEGTRSPSQEFRSLRYSANHAMNRLGTDVVDFLESFKEANRYLQQHPELLSDLGDKTLGRPKSVQDYLEWVGRRMDQIHVEDPEEMVSVRDEKEAEALKQLVERFVSGFISKKPEADEEGISGIDSEEG